MTDERSRLLTEIMTTVGRFSRLARSSGSRAWAEVDLTMPQVKALFLVADGEGITMTQLARSLGVGLPTTTGIVDRLVAHGLVRREDDPGDRRLVLLYPTDEGTELIERVLQLERARLHAVLSRLSGEDLGTVAQALEILLGAATAAALAEPTGSLRQ